MSERGLTLLLALLLDHFLGDPPSRYHPVAWMGTFIAAARRRAPASGRLAQLAYGGLLELGGVGTVLGLWALLEGVLGFFPLGQRWLLAAWLLKTTVSRRGLSRAAQQVQAALDAGDLPGARRLLSWHLVSRDTSQLSAAQVVAAAVESVAENASDGVIAPLFYYTLAGLPGALAYRFINTADSLLGYHDPAREWLGKLPARLDDLVNLLPSRLTAGLLLLASALDRRDPRRAWSIWRRDARLTASPNAGHPMSVMAGALGVELEKVGHYRLGAGGAPARPADISAAVRLLNLASVLGLAAFCALSLLRRRRPARRSTWPF